MDRGTFEQTWHQLSAEIMTGMHEWRLQHPTATLREIETALDAQLGRMRAQMLTDLALHSAAADWQQRPADERPACSQCGTPLAPRGRDTRHLQTHGGGELVLERRYGVCPACGTGLFPPG